MRLSEAQEPIRQALKRLVESPRELRCFVVIQDTIMGQFVQFCTPAPPSLFDGGSRICCPDDEPLIFDGWGDGKDGGYRVVQTCVGVDGAVISALHILNMLLPETAELDIVEESTKMERPS